MRFQRQITVEGLNLERFVRRAGACGLGLAHVRRSGGRQLTAVADDRALTKLHELAEAGGWRLTQGEAVGAGRAYRRLLARWPLAVLLLGVMLLSLMASRMMWHVELQGAGAYQADVRRAIAEAGIRVPMLRSKVDAAALRDLLEWRYPDVAWVECGWRGMTLEIRFVQGIAAHEGTAADGPCDIVAARDGIVERVVTRAGTPVAAPGDIVRAGDVLIRGAERTSGGQERAVAARGSVYARVWDAAAVQTPLRVMQSDSTGNVMELYSAAAPWFQLWPCKETGFTHQDVHRRELPLGGFFWPLKVRYETVYETDLRSVKTDYRSVLEENNRAALQRLAEFAGERESLVDNWVNWSIIEDEILLSVATGERVVDIARQERSSGMAAPE